jgi:hypothetical protein
MPQVIMEVFGEVVSEGGFFSLFTGGHRGVAKQLPSTIQLASSP